MILGAFNGAVVDTMVLGRVWRMDWAHESMPLTVTFHEPRIVWGNHQIRSEPLYAAAAQAVADTQTAQSWQAVQQVYGQSNISITHTFRSLYTRLYHGEVNDVRFIFRLAVLYVASAYKENSDGANNYLRIDDYKAEAMTALTGIDEHMAAMQEAGHGRNYVPFRATGDEDDDVISVSILHLATASSIKVPHASRNAAVLNFWPDIPSLSLIWNATSQTARLVRQATTVHASDVWRVAVDWCSTFSDVAIFRECVEYLMVMGVSPTVGNSPIFMTSELAVQLPSANMSKYVLGPLLASRMDADAQLKHVSPKWEVAISRAVFAAKAMSLCHSAWFVPYVLLAEDMGWLDYKMYNRLQPHYRVGQHGASIWGTIKKNLNQLGYSGDPGRLFSCTYPSTRFQVYVGNVRVMREHLVQWDEMARLTRTLPKSSAIWGELYPLRMETAVRPKMWFRPGAVSGGRSTQECMYGLQRIVRQLDYAWLVTGAGMEVKHVNMRPAMNYRGQVADYQFSKSSDKFGNQYEVIARIDRIEDIIAVREPKTLLFSVTWWIHHGDFTQSKMTIADVIGPVESGPAPSAPEPPRPSVPPTAGPHVGSGPPVPPDDGSDGESLYEDEAREEVLESRDPSAESYHAALPREKRMDTLERPVSVPTAARSAPPSGRLTTPPLDRSEKDRVLESERPELGHVAFAMPTMVPKTAVVEMLSSSDESELIVPRVGKMADDIAEKRLSKGPDPTKVASKEKASWAEQMDAEDKLEGPSSVPIKRLHSEVRDRAHVVAENVLACKSNWRSTGEWLYQEGFTSMPVSYVSNEIARSKVPIDPDTLSVAALKNGLAFIPVCIELHNAFVLDPIGRTLKFPTGIKLGDVVYEKEWWTDALAAGLIHPDGSATRYGPWGVRDVLWACIKSGGYERWRSGVRRGIWISLDESGKHDSEMWYMRGQEGLAAYAMHAVQLSGSIGAIIGKGKFKPVVGPKANQRYTPKRAYEVYFGEALGEPKKIAPKLPTDVDFPAIPGSNVSVPKGVLKWQKAPATVKTLSAGSSQGQRAVAGGRNVFVIQPTGRGGNMWKAAGQVTPSVQVKGNVHLHACWNCGTKYVHEHPGARDATGKLMEPKEFHPQFVGDCPACDGVLAQEHKAGERITIEVVENDDAPVVIKTGPTAVKEAQRADAAEARKQIEANRGVKKPAAITVPGSGGRTREPAAPVKSAMKSSTQKPAPPPPASKESKDDGGWKIVAAIGSSDVERGKKAVVMPGGETSSSESGSVAHTIPVEQMVKVAAPAPASAVPVERVYPRLADVLVKINAKRAEMRANPNAWKGPMLPIQVNIDACSTNVFELDWLKGIEDIEPGKRKGALKYAWSTGKCLQVAREFSGPGASVVLDAVAAFVHAMDTSTAVNWREWCAEVAGRGFEDLLNKRGVVLTQDDVQSTLDYVGTQKYGGVDMSDKTTWNTLARHGMKQFGNKQIFAMVKRDLMTTLDKWVEKLHQRVLDELTGGDTRQVADAQVVSATDQKGTATIEAAAQGFGEGQQTQGHRAGGHEQEGSGAIVQSRFIAYPVTITTLGHALRVSRLQDGRAVARVVVTPHGAGSVMPPPSPTNTTGGSSTSGERSQTSSATGMGVGGSVTPMVVAFQDMSSLEGGQRA
jgi:hypothetical protein